MQNNSDQMNKTREVPKVGDKAQNTAEGVHKDQQSLFEDENVFSESMIVEKKSVEIDSSEKENFDGGDTTIFDIPEKEVSGKELQDSAKNYYDATHESSIDEKINELAKLAERGFDDYDAEDEEELVTEKTNVDIGENKKKKDKKQRRKGVISDDDMELLSGSVSVSTTQETEEEEVRVWQENESEVYSDAEEDTAEEQPEEEAEYGASRKAQGVEYKNPLGNFDEEKTDAEVDDDEDATIMNALGKSRASFENLFGDDMPETEYTDRKQEPEILKELRHGAIAATISAVLTLILTVVCFYFEFAAGTKLYHPVVFEAGKFGVTYAMSMLQIMFVCVIFNLDGMKRAFRGLRPKKASAEGFCAAVVVICTLHSILSAILVSDSPELRSFCSVGCLSLFVLSVNSFMKAYTSLTSFCFAASKAPKLSSEELDAKTSDEAAAFEKYLDESTTLIGVTKSDFVEGFFKKCIAVPSASKNTVKMIIITLVAALAAGVWCGIFNNAYHGVCTFTVICLAALPANALISTILPFFAASVWAKKYQVSFIGEAACDAYETTGVISFDDTEVFPAKNVKVSSIRTYEDNRIDKVILYMARIFDVIEGPLSYVFANSVQSLDDKEVQVKIREHFADGISAVVDGREILVGTENFMKLYDIETPLDNIDDSFTRSLGSIMYMSVDSKLAAKFYIKYTMSRNFEPMLRAFYDAGICVGIRTLDPCITNEIVCGNLKRSNYPVSVIKENGLVARKNVAKSSAGAIICLSGVHNFLKGFIRLDSLRNVYRSNTLISIFSVIVGILLSGFMTVTGMFEIGIVALVIFQLVWCIPTILFSLLSK